MVLNFLNNLAKPRDSAVKSLSTDSDNRRTVPQNGAGYNPVPFSPSGTRGAGFQIIDPSAAIKTDFYSRQALNFINAATNELSVPYTEQQLLGAYLTSVYMFSALRRVANLISRVKIVAEINEDGKWVRAPETVRINQIFATEGAEVLSRMWLNYAVYGATAVFKTKTRRAIFEEQAGRPIYDYKDGAVAGLYVIDKPMWDLDEDVSYGKIRGLYVNQYNISDDVLGSRNYLDRREFVYVTDWNPENPNRGKSIVAVAIHEAVANAAIAQWMSEYFTRGAMPFIMVSMEDDPAMMTDADLRKVKRQFEEYWQGVGSSLRSIFFDRKVNVEQVGISADEVAAPDLNDTALEGIAAAVGLDRELVVTPSGGSQERHDALIMRAWNDTVKPLGEKFVSAFYRDLGLPPNMRLALDLSEISELEADRQDKADTEMGIYDSGLQHYNETRQRLKMTPVPELEGWYNYDGKPTPLSQITKAAAVPPQSVIDFATTLWTENLGKRSEVLELIGRKLPPDARDGYKYDIEESFDFVTGLWEQDLLTRSQVLGFIGYTMPATADDGYRSELERGKDFGDFITGLWSDNLLTRSQALQLLNMGLTVPDNAPDGYADEIGDRRQNVLDLWGENLIKKKEAMKKLGVLNENDQFDDGFRDDLENRYDRSRDSIDTVLNYWEKNLLTRNDALEMLQLPKLTEKPNGFIDEIDALMEADDKKRDLYIQLWGENLLRKSDVLTNLGHTIPEGIPDGYQQELDIINEALANKRANELTGGDEGGDGGGNSFGNFRSFNGGDDDDEPPPTYRPPGWKPLPPSYYNDNSSTRSNFAKVTSPNLPVTVPMDTDDYYSYMDDDDKDDWIELMEDYGYSPNVKPNQLLDEFDEFLMPPSQAQVYNDPVPTQGRQNSDRDSDIGLFDDDSLLQFALTDKQREDIEQAVLDELMYGFLDESILQTPDNEEPDERAIIAEAFSNALLEPADVSHSYYANADNDYQVDFSEAVTDNINDIYRVLTGHPPSKELIEQAPVLKAQPVYVALDLSNDETVKQIQDEIRSILGEEGIEYQTPETFHLSLCYAPDVSDKDVEALVNLMPKPANGLTLTVGPVNCFDTEEHKVIKIDVVLDSLLVSLQQSIIAAFNAKGIELSDHTRLDYYNPHITLAYAPTDIDFKQVELKTVVRPSRIYVSRENYEVAFSYDFDYHADFWTEDNQPNSNDQQIMMPREKYEDSAHLTKMYRDRWKATLGEPLDKILISNIPNSLKDALADYHYSKPALEAAAVEIDKGSFDHYSTWENGENPLSKHLDSKTIKVDGKAFQKNASDELKAWRKAALRGGAERATRFETIFIEADLASKIKDALTDIKNSRDVTAIRDVFDAAEYAVNNKKSRVLSREKIEAWAKKASKSKFVFDPDDDDRSEDYPVDNEDE